MEEQFLCTLRSSDIGTSKRLCMTNEKWPVWSTSNNHSKNQASASS